jgi:hypothetical protein
MKFGIIITSNRNQISHHSYQNLSLTTLFYYSISLRIYHLYFKYKIGFQNIVFIKKWII